MKDEIKEILEALKPQDEEFTKAGIKEYPLVLSVKEQKILLEHITNLQQIEQDHQKLNGELREENKKLKEELEEKETIIKEAKEAVKKIDNFDINADKCWNNLKNILNSGDKDVKD